MHDHKQVGNPMVQGVCPACGSKSLFLGENGYVTCSVLKCSEPGAATDLLKGRPVCVLMDWVREQPLAIQGTLLTAVRGPDGTPKESAAKEITKAYRWTILNNAHGRKTGKPPPGDSFMGDWSGLICDDVKSIFLKDHDAYPHHWLMHLIHTAEIVGYLHPNEEIRMCWIEFYRDMCDCFHMMPETKMGMMDRLRSRG